jgi:hypothetical protein
MGVPGFTLATLGDYDGFTQTHDLPAGNQAFNKIPNGTLGCGTTNTMDQRNEPRPALSLCDIGAYELQAILSFLPLILKAP